MQLISISPKEGYVFADRSNMQMGMIVEGDDLYNVFIKKVGTGDIIGKVPIINISQKNRLNNLEI